MSSPQKDLQNKDFIHLACTQKTGRGTVWVDFNSNVDLRPVRSCGN